VGLEALSTHEMVLASPFDYLSQALLCLPTDLRELNDPAFLEQVTAVVGDIADAIDGRTLVLFTSCLLYTSPSPRALSTSRMPASA